MDVLHIYLLILIPIVPDIVKNPCISQILISITTGYLVSYIIYYSNIHLPTKNKENTHIEIVALILHFIDRSLLNLALLRVSNTNYNIEDAFLSQFNEALQNMIILNLPTIASSSGNIYPTLTRIVGILHELKATIQNIDDQEKFLYIESTIKKMKDAIDNLKNTHMDGDDLIKDIYFKVKHHPNMLGMPFED